MSHRDDFKVIEFDIDTTDPRDVTISICCKEHDLDGTDIIDAIKHLYKELLGPKAEYSVEAEDEDDALEPVPDDKH